MRQTMVGDATALEQVLAEDFILVDVNGDVVPRAGRLEALRDGGLVFMSVARDEADVLIRHRFGLAVVIGRTHMVMRYLGVQTATDSRYTHMYVHDRRCCRLLTRARHRPERLDRDRLTPMPTTWRVLLISGSTPWTLQR